MTTKLHILAVVLQVLIASLLLAPIVRGLIQHGEVNVYQSYIKDNCYKVEYVHGNWYACNANQIQLQETLNPQVTINGKALQ